MIHRFNISWPHGRVSTWMLCCVVAVCMLAMSSGVMAQVNANPGKAPNGLPAGFGIDSVTAGPQADLIANEPTPGLFSASWDWVRRSTDTSTIGVTGGGGVLNFTTGVPITPFPDGRIVNVCNIIDGVTGAGASSNTVPEERFVGGSHFDSNPNAGGWSWDRNSPPNKNDMNHILLLEKNSYKKNENKYISVTHRCNDM